MTAAPVDHKWGGISARDRHRQSRLHTHDLARLSPPFTQKLARTRSLVRLARHCPTWADIGHYPHTHASHGHGRHWDTPARPLLASHSILLFNIIILLIFLKIQGEG
jgi:hypothetical protein